MRDEFLIKQPNIEYRGEKAYIGIRNTSHFEGMFAVVEKNLKELRKWVNSHGIAEEGPYFLRFHAINMKGTMDFEVGFVVNGRQQGDERVIPGILPGGRYANLTYTRYALRGNKELIAWAERNNLRFDRWDQDGSDCFRCRYEAYLTDYRIEQRKSYWDVDLAIRLVD